MKPRLFLFSKLLVLLVFTFPCCLPAGQAMQENQEKVNRNIGELIRGIFPIGKDRSVLVIRPNKLGKQKSLKPFIRQNPKLRFFFDQNGFFKEQLGISRKEVAAMTSLSWQQLREPGMDPNDWQSYHQYFGVLVHLGEDCEQKIIKHAKVVEEFGGQKVYSLTPQHEQMANDRYFPSFCFLDSKTVFLMRFRPNKKSDFVMNPFLSLKEGAKLKKKIPRSLAECKEEAIVCYFDDPSNIRYSLLSRSYPLLIDEWFPLIQKQIQGSTGLTIKVGFGKNIELVAEVEHENKEKAKVLCDRLLSVIAQYKNLAQRFATAGLGDVQEVSSNSLKCLESVVILKKNRNVRLEARIQFSSKVRKILLKLYEQRVVDQQIQQKMKTTSTGLFLFYEDFKKLPTAVYTHKSGHQHSWRVMMLPYLGHKDLFEKYRLDEPWDSDHNRKVTSQMPDVFRHPQADRDSTSPSFSLISGKGFAFEGPEEGKGNFGRVFQDFTDGTSNTVVGIEMKTNRHWADPRTFSEDDFFRGLEKGDYQGEKIRVFLGDGSVQDFSSKLSKEDWSKVFSIGGGDFFDYNDIRHKKPRLLDLKLPGDRDK